MLLDAFSKGLKLAAAPSANDDGPHWMDAMIGNAHVLIGNWKDPVTGKALTVDDVLACSVMWKGINLIAGVTANTSIDLKRELKNGIERIAVHPALRVLSKPTKTETWYEFMETSMIRYFLFGATYNEKLLDGNFQVGGLAPLEPWAVRPWLLSNGEMEFRYTKWGYQYKFHQSQIHRLKGPSVDGYTGAAAADYAAKAIMTLRSFDEYALRFFTADAVPPIILKVKGRPDVAEKRTIRDAWERLHGGITNSRKVGVIGQDIEVEALNPSSNKDNELSAQQLMIIQHCARFLNLPNHALGDLTKSGFSNISQQSLEMLVYTFAPLMTRIQQRMTVDLLTDQQRAQGFYYEFDPYDLKWADPKEQSEQLIKEVQGGIKSPNEARRRTGENPQEGGDELMFNSAMLPLSLLMEAQKSKIKATEKMAEAAEKAQEQGDKTGEEEADPKEDPKEEKEDAEEKKKKTDEAFRPLFLDVATRMTRRADEDIEKASKTRVLKDWAPGWLANKHEPDLKQNFEPALSAYLKQVDSDQKSSEVLQGFVTLVSSYYAAHLANVETDEAQLDLMLTKWRNGRANALVEILMEGVGS